MKKNSLIDRLKELEALWRKRGNQLYAQYGSVDSRAQLVKDTYDGRADELRMIIEEAEKQ